MRIAPSVVLVGACICASAADAAGDPRYRIRVGSVDGLIGGSATLSVYLDLDVNGQGAPVDGWSFGICHEGDAAVIHSAVAGDAIPLLRDGAGVDFLRIDVFPRGVTETVIVDVGQTQAALPRNDLEVLRIRYSLQGRACPVNPKVEVCGTLGAPPLEVACVVDRQALEPQREHGVLHIGCAPLVALATATDVSAARGQTVLVPVLISNERPAEAVSFALAAREGLLVPAGLDVEGTRAGALRGGAGPEYLKTHIEEFGRCIGVALVGSTSETDATIPAGWEQPLLRIEFRPPDREGTETLEFSDACGDFAAPCVVAIQGISVPAETVGSSVVVTAGPAGGFIRGDVNFDRKVDIADAIAGLAVLFSGRRHDCHDAIDANDDGAVNIADAIYVLSYLFAHGPAPKPPFAAPGIDPTQDATGCVRFPF